MTTGHKVCIQCSVSGYLGCWVPCFHHFKCVCVLCVYAHTSEVSPGAAVLIGQPVRTTCRACICHRVQAFPQSSIVHVCVEPWIAVRLSDMASATAGPWTSFSGLSVYSGMVWNHWWEGNAGLFFVFTLLLLYASLLILIWSDFKIFVDLLGVRCCPVVFKFGLFVF